MKSDLDNQYKNTKNKLSDLYQLSDNVEVINEKQLSKLVHVKNDICENFKNLTILLPYCQFMPKYIDRLSNKILFMSNLQSMIINVTNCSVSDNSITKFLNNL